MDTTLILLFYYYYLKIECFGVYNKKFPAIRAILRKICPQMATVVYHKPTAVGIKTTFGYHKPQFIYFNGCSCCILSYI